MPPVSGFGEGAAQNIGLLIGAIRAGTVAADAPDLAGAEGIFEAIGQDVSLFQSAHATAIAQSCDSVGTGVGSKTVGHGTVLADLAFLQKR